MTERATERETERATERATERCVTQSHCVKKFIYSRAIMPFLVNFFLTRDFVKKSEVCSKFVRTLFELV